MPGPIDLCPHCLASLPVCGGGYRPPRGFDAIVCPWRYEFPVAQLVQALKFHGDRAPARLLGTLLAQERLAQGGPLPDYVIPVPLHPLRLRERGYNQAALLAGYAAAELGLHCERFRLHRRRATAGQTGLGSAARARNVRDAFVADARLAGRRVALLDDVITTGSTVAAAAVALRAAGAAGIELWVVARVARAADCAYEDRECAVRECAP